MATPGSPVNADPRKTQLPIRFGDIIQITETDDPDALKTNWTLAFLAGRPVLRPILPTAPGLYVVDGHDNLHEARHLLLTENGGWFWLDVTAFHQDGVLVGVSEHEVAGFALTPVHVVPS